LVPSTHAEKYLIFLEIIDVYMGTSVSNTEIEMVLIIELEIIITF
jgi:hypothetical protein